MFTDIYHQPQFYRKWVRRVEMWERRVRHYKPLGEAALDLAEVITGDAAPIIEDIDWHDLDRQDGVQRIVEALKVFDEQTVYHVGDLMEQYDQFLRHRGETLLAMVARFEQLEMRCRNGQLDLYKGTARAFRLLRVACLSAEHRRGILVAAGHEWDYAKLVTAMRTQWPTTPPPWNEPARWRTGGPQPNDGRGSGPSHGSSRGSVSSRASSSVPSSASGRRFRNDRSWKSVNSTESELIPEESVQDPAADTYAFWL